MKCKISIAATLLVLTAAFAVESRLQVNAWRPGTKEKRAANRAKIVDLPASATQQQIAARIADLTIDGLRLDLPVRPLGTAEGCKSTVDEVCRLLGSRAKSTAGHDGLCGGDCLNGWGLDLRLTP